MAAQETGLTALVFGHASLTSTSVDTAKARIVGDIPYTQKPAVNVEVKDGDGKVITRRKDDITETLNLTLRVKADFTALTIGATVAIANCTRTELNGNYEVADIGIGLKGGDFADYNVALIASEGVTLS